MINPIEHARTKDESSKYKVEPYVLAADVYGQGNLAGRGGWTWYTGSSSWMYIAGIQYILGLNIENGYLYIEPHIPSSWDEYSMRYKYGNSIYNINVINKGKKLANLTNTIEVKCNGKVIEDRKIKLIDNGGTYNIDVYLGTIL